VPALVLRTLNRGPTRAEPGSGQNHDRGTNRRRSRSAQLAGIAEGKSTWLAAGALAALFLVTPVWVRYGGSASAALPPTPANPAAVLENGQKIAFAAGDLEVGDGLLCESGGLRVGAWVPSPRHTTSAHLTGSNWTASIRVRSRGDGSVIASCS